MSLQPILSVEIISQIRCHSESRGGREPGTPLQQGWYHCSRMWFCLAPKPTELLVLRWEGGRAACRVMGWGYGIDLNSVLNSPYFGGLDLLFSVVTSFHLLLLRPRKGFRFTLKTACSWRLLSTLPSCSLFLCHPCP